jgi:hypothetical protein
MLAVLTGAVRKWGTQIAGRPRANRVPIPCKFHAERPQRSWEWAGRTASDGAAFWRVSV